MPSEESLLHLTSSGAFARLLVQSYDSLHPRRLFQNYWQSLAEIQYKSIILSMLPVESLFHTSRNLLRYREL